MLQKSPGPSACQINVLLHTALALSMMLVAPPFLVTRRKELRARHARWKPYPAPTRPLRLHQKNGARRELGNRVYDTTQPRCCNIPITRIRRSKPERADST